MLLYCFTNGAILEHRLLCLVNGLLKIFSYLFLHYISPLGHFQIYTFYSHSLQVIVGLTTTIGDKI